MQDEIIQHLFFDCHYAKFMWRAINFSFGLDTPRSVQHMCYGWLQGVGSKNKSKILVGAVAMCWSIWLSRNVMVFDKCLMKTYM